MHAILTPAPERICAFSLLAKLTPQRCPWNTSRPVFTGVPGATVGGQLRQVAERANMFQSGTVKTARLGLVGSALVPVRGSLGAKSRLQRPLAARSWACRRAVQRLMLWSAGLLFAWIARLWVA